MQLNNHTPLNPSFEPQPLNLIQQVREAFRTRPEKGYAFTGARKLKRGTRGKRIYSFTSEKAGGRFNLEGALEYAHALSLERSPYVANFRTQALYIPYSSNNLGCPDFIVETVHNQYEIHEIKPDLNHLSIRDRNKFAALERIASQFGIVFKTFDQQTLFSKAQADELNRHYQAANLRRWTKEEIRRSEKIITDNPTLNTIDLYQLLEASNLHTALLDYHIFYTRFPSHLMQEGN